MSNPLGPDSPTPRSWTAPTSPIPPPPAVEEQTTGRPQPKSGRKRSLRILGVVAIAVAAWGIGLGMGLAGGDDDTDTGGGSGSNAASVSDGGGNDRPAQTTTTRADYVPQPADFTVNVVVLSKSCFGSAGCNVTYTVELSYLGAPLDPSDTWQVIYDVAGGEQVQTETIEVTGTNYSYRPESFISTANEGAVLTATVTMVRQT